MYSTSQTSQHNYITGLNKQQGLKKEDPALIICWYQVHIQCHIISNTSVLFCIQIHHMCLGIYVQACRHTDVHTQATLIFVWFLDASRRKKSTLLFLSVSFFFFLVLKEHASAWSQAAKGHNKTTSLQLQVSPEHQAFQPTKLRVGLRAPREMH